MATAFLRANPPRIRQFRSPRRNKLTGCTVLHSTESVFDEVGADTGAEGVARYMVTRTTYGSYHDVLDSDSIVHLVDYSDEAYQDGTGSNRWALSLSFACRTVDWKKMSKAYRKAILRRGAEAFVRQQEWRKRNGHPLTALRLITKAQSDRGESGFIYHGVRDPGRRTDPGTTKSNPFPFAEFLAEIRDVMAGKAPIQEIESHPVGKRVLRRTSPTMKGTDVIAVQQWAGVAADGSYGDDTVAGIKRVGDVLRKKGEPGINDQGIVDHTMWKHFAEWRAWRQKVDADAAKPAPKPPAPKPAAPAKPAKPALPRLGKYTGPKIGLNRLENSRAYHKGVEKWQEALILQGFMRRGADEPGRFGDDTEAGTKALQRQRGLRDDGYVGPKTWPEGEKWS